MEVDGFLADSVVVAEGKLYAQGAGWNTISVQSLPAVHDRVLARPRSSVSVPVSVPTRRNRRARTRCRRSSTSSW